jgi:hypothetical protein
MTGMQMASTSVQHHTILESFEKRLALRCKAIF